MVPGFQKKIFFYAFISFLLKEAGLKWLMFKQSEAGIAQVLAVWHSFIWRSYFIRFFLLYPEV
jgi:hypothetical protein